MFKDQSENSKTIFAWLVAIAIMVFFMMIIGAITRLTDSGLSIVEWRLVWGFLPPTSTQEWQRIFSLYQETEQFRSLNTNMTLGEFKSIFWWEYIHRLWGRLIGVLFVIAFIAMLAKRGMPVSVHAKMIAVLVLGGLQAFLGWWMVQGSLQNSIAVEPVRLMLHLGLAFILWGYLISWLTAVNNEINWRYSDGNNANVRYVSSLLVGLLFLLVLLGALVAGLKAGFVHNDWPLMGGSVVPKDYFASGLGWGSFWQNAVESPAAAQFHHRWFAIIVFAFVVYYRLYHLPRMKVSDRVTASADVMLGMVLLQAILGIVTLVAVVPLWLGVAHQAMAALTFATAVRHWRLLRPIG